MLLLQRGTNNIKFAVRNTGGLKSKLRSEDIYETITENDMVGLLEIKMDNVDVESIRANFPDFEIFTNVDEEYSIKPRGGIIVLIKQKLTSLVTIYPPKHNIALFFKISASILCKNRHLICGCVYVSPKTLSIVIRIILRF